jgi:VanZ like family
MKIWKILPLLWATLMLVMVGLPGYRFPNLPMALPGLDKLVHAGLFGIWAFLLWKANFSRFTISLLVVGYSGATELAQAYFFIQRSADPLDHVANCLGGGIGLWLSTATTMGRQAGRGVRSDTQKNNN